MIRMVPVADAVPIPFVVRPVRDGEFRTEEIMEAAARKALDELLMAGTPLVPLPARFVARPAD